MVGTGALATAEVIVHQRPRSSATEGRINSLDSIRGMAAVVVVIHHCFLTQPAYSNYFFSHWHSQSRGLAEFLFFSTPIRLVWDGYESVTLFYVLSGFVLAIPWLSDRPPVYYAYCIGRVCRIYLPYMVIILLAAAVETALSAYSFVDGLSDWVNRMTWTNPVTGRGLLDQALMIGHYNTIDGVTHSLIWEMRVSLLFPLIIIPVKLWRLPGALLVAGALTSIVSILQSIFSGTGHPLDLLQIGDASGLEAKFVVECQWTTYYGYFFLLGSILCLYAEAIKQRLRSMSAALLVVGLLIFQGHWSQRHSLQEMMVAIGSSLIIASALPEDRVGAWLDNSLLRWLGKISYSLYLVHVPVILTCIIALRGVVQIPVIIALAPFIALGMAWAFDRAVAQPSAELGKHLVRLISYRRRASAEVISS